MNSLTSTATTSSTRSRWAAIGAAVAVTLGAGSIGIANAATDSGDGPVSAFFPIEPCRLVSNEAILADSSITVDGWGTTGGCDLPDDITGLAANVTAVGATQQTNLRFYAEGADVPDTANLNPSPGAAPTPNAVNITLNDTSGQFEVYNRFGQVSVFIDVMGYYDDHTHDDRYYTETEVDTALAASSGVDYSTVNINVPLDNPNVADLQALEVEIPADGHISITATAQIVGQDGTSVVCSVGTAPTTQGTIVTGVQFLGGVYITNFTLTGGLAVSAGTLTLYHNCRQDNGADGDAVVQQSALSVVFSPNRL